MSLKKADDWIDQVSEKNREREEYDDGPRDIQNGENGGEDEDCGEDLHRARIKQLDRRG